MEERMGTKNHKVSILNRNGMQVTGVTDVISFDTNEIVLNTEGGLMMIHGQSLHINHLILEKGEVHMDGQIDSLVYSNAQKTSKSLEKGLGRLFGAR